MRSIVEFLTEAISSGKYRDQKPEYGCSIEEIVDWLRSRGIREVKKYTGYTYYPEDGKLMAETGPQDHRPSTHWVSLTNSVPGHQTVILRPKTKSAFQDERKDNQTPITFDKALELMELMLDNPDKPVKL